MNCAPYLFPYFHLQGKEPKLIQLSTYHGGYQSNQLTACLIPSAGHGRPGGPAHLALHPLLLGVHLSAP